MPYAKRLAHAYMGSRRGFGPDFLRQKPDAPATLRHSSICRHRLTRSRRSTCHFVAKVPSCLISAAGSHLRARSSAISSASTPKKLPECFISISYLQKTRVKRRGFLKGTSRLARPPFRLRLRRLDGSSVWVDIQGAALETAKGEVYAISATITAVEPLQALKRKDP